MRVLGHATLPVDFDWLANQASLLRQLESRHKSDLLKAQWQDHVLPPHLKPDPNTTKSSAPPPRTSISSSRDRGGSLSGHNNKAEPSSLSSDLILIEDHSLAGMLVELNVRLDPSLLNSNSNPSASPLILTISIAFDLSQVDSSALSRSRLSHHQHQLSKGVGAYPKLRELNWDSSKAMVGRRALRVLSSTTHSSLSTTPGLYEPGNLGAGGGGRGSLWSPFHPNSTSHLGSGVTDGSMAGGAAHGLTLIPVGPGLVLETSTLIASSAPLINLMGSNATATKRELLRSLCQVIPPNPPNPTQSNNTQS